MMRKAWSSIEEVPYCFLRSTIKFQGHTAKKIVKFDPNWAFPDCKSSLNSPMAMKCCTKLETAKERCSIVFQGHPSNFKVTRYKTSPILTQIGRFRTIGRSQLSNPSDLPCFIKSTLVGRRNESTTNIQMPKTNAKHSYIKGCEQGNLCNMKMQSYKYVNLHYKDNGILRLSYINDLTPYSWLDDLYITPHSKYSELHKIRLIDVTNLSFQVGFYKKNPRVHNEIVEFCWILISKNSEK